MTDFYAVMTGIIIAFGYAAYRLYVKPYPAEDEPASVPILDLQPHPEPQNSPLETSSTHKPATLPTSSHEANKATLDNLCLAIRDFEGKPGDQNYRLNNPGNCRYSPVGYLKIYEPVKMSKNGFAIFKDYATGWLYLRNMLKQKIKKHPTWTLYDLINNYAPPEDDNPVDNYARFVAKRLAVDIHFPVKDIVLT